MKVDVLRGHNIHNLTGRFALAILTSLESSSLHQCFSATNLHKRCPDHSAVRELGFRDFADMRAETGDAAYARGRTLYGSCRRWFSGGRLGVSGHRRGLVRLDGVLVMTSAALRSSLRASMDGFQRRNSRNLVEQTRRRLCQEAAARFVLMVDCLECDCG